LLDLREEIVWLEVRGAVEDELDGKHKHAPVFVIFQRSRDRHRKLRYVCVRVSSRPLLCYIRLFCKALLVFIPDDGNTSPSARA